MVMKRLIVFLVITTILLPAFIQAGEIQRIQQRGVITVSLNREYPPFCMEKDGTLSGLDVDLANMLAHFMGVKVRFVMPETYDQQIPKLMAGETDIIMAAMTRTVERGLLVSFTKPYFEVSQAALARRDKVPEGADSYFDLLDVQGLRLGVKSGTTHESFARQLFPDNVIKLYPTATAAAYAVVQGEIDAMVADSPFVQVWRNTHIQHYSSITALLAPVTREFYAFAIRQGDPDFLNWLNLFVDQISTDGTLELLKFEYFEQMAWAGQESAPTQRLNRAQFLKNKFIDKKRALIEQQRKAFQGKGDSYE